MKRYIPQVRLPEIGENGQKKLRDSQVLIVGCGALGSPAALYLAGSGVGTITIADFDTIELTNLHRQVFYREKEVGEKKAECLKERILSLNSEVGVEVYNQIVTRKWLEANGRRFTLIIDAADNPATTYMLDEFCSTEGIAFSTAGVSEWRAQVFFYYPGSANYSDIFPKPSEEQGILPCSLAGIVGPVAAFAASLQAVDVIKYLTGSFPEKQSHLINADLLNTKIDIIQC